MDPERVLRIGKITAVFGIKGELRIYRMAEDDAFFEPGRKSLVGVNEKDMRNCTVAESRPYKNLLRVLFKEVPDRTAAEKFVGSYLYILRKDLPETDGDTWYWCDLIGLSVYAVDDRYIGRVTSMIETGSNDVFVVEGEKGETLIPVISPVVLDIDPAKGRIVVDLPEGL